MLVRSLVLGGVKKQAKIRLYLSFVIVIYLGYLALFSNESEIVKEYVTLINILQFIYSVSIFVLSYYERLDFQLRWIGMLGDIFSLSLAIYVINDLGAAFYPVYFWIILANGIRFGTRYLDAAVILSAISFSIVLCLSPYWLTHIEFGVGLLLGMIVIPIYLVKALLVQLNGAFSEAVRANKAKSQFLANISHELRTPLNGIVASVDLLRDENLGPDAREKVDMIADAAQSQMALINDVLDLSKAESGKMREESSPVSLQTIIQHVNSVMSPQAEARGIEYQVDLPEDMKQKARLYPRAMQQVLINLVGNAIKFTEQGSVRLQARSLIDKEGNNLWRFEIIDTGIGIEESALKNIFDPFVQADDSVTRKYGGTGLGTAISRQLVEMMGGQIGCESVPGKGSCFWFEIPVELADAEAGGEDEKTGSHVLTDAAPREATPPLAVLVADDNQTNRDILEMILRKAGHRVTLVEDGLQALEALGSGQHFDLVILDRNMPEMDGLTVFQTYRENTAGLSEQQPGFMLITADGTDETRNLVVQSGVDCFMTKPIRPQELLDAIGEMFIFPGEEEEKETEPDIESALRLAIDNTTRQASAVDDAGQAEAVLDHQKLEELEALSPGLSEQMIEGFVNDGDRLIREFRQACADRDYGRILDIAHALKGSALQLGAQRLADYCHRLKTLKRSELNGKADDLEREMKYLYLQARNQLLAAHQGANSEVAG